MQMTSIDLNCDMGELPEAIADGTGTNILRNSLWLEIIGPDFIAKAFQYAHQADPDAILRWNTCARQLDRDADTASADQGLMRDLGAEFGEETRSR